MERLTVKTATIDTLIISVILFVASFIWDAVLMRWILTACLLMALVELFVSAYETDTNNLKERCFFSGFMSVALLLAIVLVHVYHIDGKQFVLCLGLAMASDAGGLFFGRTFGKSKPAFTRKLSPNKTWVGYFGELVTTWALGWIGLHVMNMPINLPNVLFVTFGFVACAAGDLLGSGAKRELSIKHSNECLLDKPILGKIETIMRSRHGFLDCMDSASCAIIFYVLLLGFGRLL